MISTLPKTWPFLMVAVLAGALYDGWIFYSRWSASRDAEQRLQAKQAEETRRTIELMGGGQLKILNF